MTTEEHETITSKTPWTREKPKESIRAAEAEQKSIANQRAFKSLDHNPQFLLAFTLPFFNQIFLLYAHWLKKLNREANDVGSDDTLKMIRY